MQVFFEVFPTVVLDPSQSSQLVNQQLDSLGMCRQYIGYPVTPAIPTNSAYRLPTDSTYRFCLPTPPANYAYQICLHVDFVSQLCPHINCPYQLCLPTLQLEYTYVYWISLHFIAIYLPPSSNTLTVSNMQRGRQQFSC